MIQRTHRALISGLALMAVMGTSMPALAQATGDEARLRKLEAEVRALQRKVFPGGDGRFFEPQITPGQTATGPATPSTTAVTDILVRLDAMEAQIAALTSQTEENSNALLQLTNRIVALETTPGMGAGGTPGQAVTTVAVSPAASGTTAPAAARPAATTPVAASGANAERLAAVSQIAKPQTDDPADDEYSYGFRLWNAGFYPEAQQQLTMFAEKYPTHWRATYGRNLLGRAFLDDGKPGDAAAWFLRNYQANKQDARAPDSLLYLAETMIKMKDTNRACIALAEFSDTYPALASGRLAEQYQANVKKVTCN